MRTVGQHGARELDSQWEHRHSRKSEVAQLDVPFRVKQKVLSVECRRSASTIRPEHEPIPYHETESDRHLMISTYIRFNVPVNETMFVT